MPAHEVETIDVEGLSKWEWLIHYPSLGIIRALRLGHEAKPTTGMGHHDHVQNLSKADSGVDRHLDLARTIPALRARGHSMSVRPGDSMLTLRHERAQRTKRGARGGEPMKTIQRY